MYASDVVTERSGIEGVRRRHSVVPSPRTLIGSPLTEADTYSCEASPSCSVSCNTYGSSYTMPLPPKPPFASWPLQHRDDHYGYAWYCGGGLIVSHITTPHGTVAAAIAYHDYEERMLREHARDCKQAGGLFVIHDWRAMQTYDAGARRVWQERMRERPKGYLRGSIVCVSSAGALLRMAVQAANLVASVVHTAHVELTTDLEEALRAHNVPLQGPQSPRSGSH